MRRGFTLLEILITVAIIAIMIAGATVGLRSLTNSSNRQSTVVLLGSARAMLNDFLDATRSSASAAARRPQPNGWPFNDELGTSDPVTPAEIVASSLSFWVLPAFDDVNSDGLRQEGEQIIPLTAPGEYNPAAANEPYQYYNTRVAIHLMSGLPTIKKSLSEVTSNSREKPGSIPPPPTGGYPAVTALHLLDAWGNPLLFVPAGGLMGVEREGYPAGNDYKNAIKSPDERPFWASAGPDGRFDKGDDNLYSFEN